MKTIEFIIYFLATWRIASLFVNEDGPALIFRRIRTVAGIVHDENGNPTIIPETFISGILGCIWCMSVWIGFFWTALWMLSPDWAFVFALPFAISAGAILTVKHL